MNKLSPIIKKQSPFILNGEIILNFIINIVCFPQYEDYERDKQSKFLHTTLLITFFAAFYFAIINQGGTALAFGTLSASSIFGIYLNRSGKYLLGAILITSLTIFALFFNFYDGISLQDPGIVALPIIIIFSGFLFGRKFIFPITAIMICGISAIVHLERAGLIIPPIPTSDRHVIIIDILIVVSAFLLKVILGNWEVALEKAHSAEQKMKEAYLLTLEGWAKTLEFHDRETEGHSRRVTSLCLRFAKTIGIDDEQELEHISWGSLLHDIGKIAISDQILQKKETLSEFEWGEIRKHPEKARELLKDIPFLKPILPIPIAHHENWDGKGYPFGLSKEEIPLHARIFSIVDNWDALTTDRPYRKAWPVEEVKCYILQQAGKKFDPKLVEIFLEFINKEE